MPTSSSLDLSAAIEAAHRAACPIPGCTATREAATYITAAAPIIEAVVREQIAAEIKDEAAYEERNPLSAYSSGAWWGLILAARIARGST